MIVKDAKDDHTTIPMRFTHRWIAGYPCPWHIHEHESSENRTDCRCFRVTHMSLWLGMVLHPTPLHSTDCPIPCWHSNCYVPLTADISIRQPIIDASKCEIHGRCCLDYHESEIWKGSRAQARKVGPRIASGNFNVRTFTAHQFSALSRPASVHSTFPPAMSMSMLAPSCWLNRPKTICAFFGCSASDMA